MQNFHFCFLLLPFFLFAHISLTHTFAGASELEGCGAKAKDLTRNKQRVLLAEYAKSIEDANAKEHMETVEKCVERLSSLFRLRLFDSLPIEGLEDVGQEAEKIAKKLLENLCQKGLDTLRNTMGLNGFVLETLQKDSDIKTWMSILKSIEKGNQSISNSCRRRLRDILQ